MGVANITWLSFHRQAWEYSQRIETSSRTCHHTLELFSRTLQGLRNKYECPWKFLHLMTFVLLSQVDGEVYRGDSQWLHLLQKGRRTALEEGHL